MVAHPTEASAPCPCGLAESLANCCGRYVRGEASAPDPESLMRSRYTAFALGTDESLDYLVATHHKRHRSPHLREELASNMRGILWKRLEVLAASETDDSGQVEFVATFQHAGQVGELRERSQFVRESGEWLYTTGVVAP